MRRKLATLLDRGLSHSSSSESAHERKRSEASSGRRPEELALELSSQSETLVRALRACPKCDARRDGQPRSVNYWKVTQGRPCAKSLPRVRAVPALISNYAGVAIHGSWQHPGDDGDQSRGCWARWTTTVVPSGDWGRPSRGASPS